ncbi:hypothetical protein E2562_018633 [Oryza meyeriana var. granulata]|uniref:Agglutinin domain-containing protein n=1 Tax=Oryza meyeriana var. granulata TaxID=110450 RepID=A0A6G1BY82_9ORYZ|nr:hypothetical protein E2562_018633 [Oryza meyeriana var. granulata]
MGGCLASPQPDPSEEQDEEFPSSRSPRCVAFQLEQNGKRLYLRYSPGGGGNRRSTLRLNGDSVASPYTRFYVEPSREHDGLVHVRCCYDNRYWVAQQRPDDGSSVVGAADEAEEDLTKTSCTLFRITRGAHPRFVRLLHVHLEKYACLPASSDNMPKLEAVNLSLLKGDDVIDSYTIQDLSQQVVLPRYLAFKCDKGRYLRARRQERHFYLEFSGRDIRDEAVLNTVNTNDDGTIRVRSNYVGKFWRRSPNWIWADCSGDDVGAGDDTLFRAIRFGGFFALQNLGNDYFCKRLTTDGKRNCLNAGTPTITAEARLQLEEAVVSREIYNVVFDISQARIYGKIVVNLGGTASAVNGTTSNNTAKLTLEYTDKEKRTWDSKVTMKLGVADTTICTGVPVIVSDATVEVSAEFTGSYSWGSSVEKETTQKVAYEVAVPPKTRVTVASMATKASCDVPFSYTQRDTLVNGLQVTYDMDDGLYTGVNHYDFKYVTGEKKVSEMDSNAVSSL